MVEEELHEIPPRERLLALEELLKHARSIGGIRSRVCKYLKCGGSEIKEFHYKIEGHDWKGLIYLKRNSLMGTIFSKFDQKVVIIRGFPKIRYTHDSKVKDKECYAEEKIDGTNIGIFVLPDGTIMGKTRKVERWDKGSKKMQGNWKMKFERTPLFENVYSLAKAGYLVYCELYGYQNQGEFVKYTVPLGLKVIGIIDREKYNFLPRGNVEMLCKQYALPRPFVYFEGKLTQDMVIRLEFEIERDVRLDGMEGLVAKFWDSEDLDTYFCKIKCEKVKEACFKVSRSLIPANIIRKNIKKALDECLDRTIAGIYPLVREELSEEYDEDILENSKGKIKALIRYVLTPSDEALKETVKEQMIELAELGIEIEDPKNKAKVLSSLHDRLGDIRGGTLFKIYNELLIEMKGQW